MTADEQAISDISKQLETAWNASDSRAFAAPFAEEADFIHIYGGHLLGRAAIEASHRHIFDTVYKGSHNQLSLRSVRVVRPDVAIVFCQAHLKFYEGNETRLIETRPTMILVKQQGKWQIIALQNTRIAEMPVAAQAASRLAD